MRAVAGIAFSARCKVPDCCVERGPGVCSFSVFSLCLSEPMPGLFAEARRVPEDWISRTCRLGGHGTDVSERRRAHYFAQAMPLLDPSDDWLVALAENRLTKRSVPMFLLYNLVLSRI